MTTYCMTVCLAAFLADLANVPIVQSLEKTLPVQMLIQNVSTIDEQKFEWLYSVVR